MEAFKFLHSNDVHFWTDKSQLILSKISYYRLLYGSEWIFDPADSTARNKAVNLKLDQGGTQTAQGAALLKAGIATTKDTKNITVNITTFDPGPDYYIFCASEGPFEQALAGMMEAQESERYDACIRIADFDELFSVIGNTGIIMDGEQELARIDEVWQQARLGHVEYITNEETLNDGAFVSPDPFKKGPKFAAQRELRMVFEQRNLPERLTVKFDAPKGLIEQVDWKGVHYEFVKPNLTEIIEDAKNAIKQLSLMYAVHQQQDNEIYNASLSNDERIKKMSELIKVQDYEWSQNKGVEASRLSYRHLRSLGHSNKELDFICLRPFDPTRLESFLDELSGLISEIEAQLGV